MDNIDIFNSFVKGQKGPLIIFDYSILFFAVVITSVVLAAVAKSHFEMTVYRRYLISHLWSGLLLSLVNFFAIIHGSINEPANRRTSVISIREEKMEYCMTDLIRSFQLVAYFATLFNLGAMSIDLYIGILRPISDSVFKTHSLRISIGIWIATVFIGFLDYPVTMYLYMTSGNRSLLQHQMFFNSNQFEVNGNLLSNNVASSVTLMTVNITSDYVKPQGKTVREFVEGLTHAQNNELSDILTVKMEKGEMPDEELVVAYFLLNGKAYPQSSNAPVSLWCKLRSESKAGLEMAVMTLTLFCLAGMAYGYIRIFKAVRKVSNISSLILLRLANTTFFLLVTFIVCWTPFMTLELFMIIWTKWLCPYNKCRIALSNFVLFGIHNVFNSAILFYPLVDSLVYATRMWKIKRTILEQLVKCLPCAKPWVEQISGHKPSTQYRINSRSSENLATNDGSGQALRAAIDQEMSIAYEVNDTTL